MRIVCMRLNVRNLLYGSVFGLFDMWFFNADYTEHVHKPENEVILFHVSDSVKVPSYAYTGGSIAAHIYSDGLSHSASIYSWISDPSVWFEGLGTR